MEKIIINLEKLYAEKNVGNIQDDMDSGINSLVTDLKIVKCHGKGNIFNFAVPKKLSFYSYKNMLLASNRNQSSNSQIESSNQRNKKLKISKISF